MQFALRSLLGLVLLGCAALVQAQQVNVVGSANGIPFSPACNTTAGVSYTFSDGNLVASFACSGISFVCVAQPLPSDPTTLVSLQVGSLSKLTLNCGGATTIAGLETFIEDLYPDLASYTAQDPPADAPFRMCLGVAGGTVSDPRYDAASHTFSYTCTGGSHAGPLACFTLSGFGYDSQNPRTLLMPRCIDASQGPQNSPYLYESSYEGLEPIPV